MYKQWIITNFNFGFITHASIQKLLSLSLEISQILPLPDFVCGSSSKAWPFPSFYMVCLIDGCGHMPDPFWYFLKVHLYVATSRLPFFEEKTEKWKDHPREQTEKGANFFCYNRGEGGVRKTRQSRENVKTCHIKKNQKKIPYYPYVLILLNHQEIRKSIFWGAL